MNKSFVYIFMAGFCVLSSPLFTTAQARDAWEPNDTLAEARLLGVPPGFNGSDPGTYAILEPGGTDWFRLPAPSSAAKWFSVWVEGVTETYGSEDFDPRLELYRGDIGTSLASSDNLGNGSFMPGLAGIPVIQNVSAVFEITGFDPFDEGPYRVYTLTSLATQGPNIRDVTETEPNDTAGTANVLNDDQNVEGRLDSVADEDWFQVDLGPSTYEDLLVAMRNDTGVDIKLEVFDPTGTFPLAATVFDGRNGLDDFVVVPHGKHSSPMKLFRVTTTNGTGNYQLFFGYGIPNTVLCENASLTITDNDPLGIESTLNIPPEAIIGDLDVRVRLTHPDTGELTIELEHDDTGSTAVLYQGACPGNMDLHLTFDDEYPFGIGCPLGAGDRLTPATPDALSVFEGENVNGDWTLRVIDNSPGNTGTLEDWCLEVTQPLAIQPPTPTPTPRMYDCVGGYGSEPNVAIPDAPSATEDGVISDDIAITDPGTVADMNVFVWIEHPNIADLNIRLTKQGELNSTVLWSAACGGAPGNDIFTIFDDEGLVFSDPADCPPIDTGVPIGPVNSSFPLSNLDGLDLAGTWTLTVTDFAPGNGTGASLVKWCLLPTVQLPPTPTPTASPTPTETSTPQPTATSTVDFTCTSSYSSMPALMIPDAIGGSIQRASDTIAITDPGTLTDLNVFVDIEHPVLLDLIVRLIHQDTGTEVVLYSTSTCFGSVQRDVTGVFDDEGQPAPCPPVTLDPMMPTDELSDLSVFDGLPIAGTWVLEVGDASVGGTGVLKSWCLLPTVDTTGTTPTPTPTSTMDPNPPTPTPTQLCVRTTDLDNDGDTDAADLLEAIRQVSGMASPGAQDADQNCDGLLSAEDLFILQLAWKTSNP